MAGLEGEPRLSERVLLPIASPRLPERLPSACKWGERQQAPWMLPPGTGPELGQEKPVAHYRISPGAAPAPYTQGEQRDNTQADRDGFEQESALKFIFLILFIYLLVLGCPGSSLLRGLSPVAGSWGFSRLRRARFSLQWRLLLWSTGSHRLSS